MIEGIARAMYKTFNIIPRSKQTVKVKNESYPIDTFTDTAMVFLLTDDLSAKDVLNLAVTFCLV